MRSISHSPDQPPHPLTPTSQAWRRVAGASALAVLMGLASFAPVAQALSLGRLTVQSALGEPLRAEIDIPELTAAEASSLRIGLASAEVYRAAGVDFNGALANTDISLARRPNGQAYLRIGNARIVNEPYLDLILEASWASGRIVRDYTMLFDPPNLRVPAPAPLLPPVIAAAAPVPPRTAAPQAPAIAPAQAPAPISAPRPAPTAPTEATSTPVRSAEAVAKAPLAPATPPAAAVAPRPPAARAPVQAAPAAQPDTVTVKRGDTAGRIAENAKPANATLEQMLVAMLRANPDAFIADNVNRLKAGAVLDMPDSAETQAVPADQARQLIAAQSRDFNAFRQRLAAAAPAAAAQASSRQATGRIQADVADQRPAAAAADQLKLSKGAVASPGTTLPEQKIAQARQSQELSDRSAELARNISDLNRLGAAATPSTEAAPSTAPAAATAALTGPAVTAAVTPPATTTPPPTEEAPAAPAAAATPAETPPPPTAEPPPAPPPAAEPPAPAPAAPMEPPPPEPGILDSVMDNPMVLPAAGGLIALLLGLGAYRLNQRRKKSGVDSSFLESRLQPDSFFGASGGQNIDTAEAAATGSSMMYSPSQLDVGGDVDPVAEADVYLAYGRDLQAEEILKEAMRVTPKRVAIHAKMLEIYAKRRDIKAFEILACEVYALTQGQGPEWTHACAMGQELDPANPLYQPGGSPANLAAAATVVQDSSPGMANTQPFEPSAFDTPQNATQVDEGSASSASVDLDLDFSIDSPAAPPEAGSAAANSTAVDDGNALNFDLDLDLASNSATASAPADATEPSFDLDMPDLSFDLPASDDTPPADSPAKADAADSLDDLGLNFDLSGEPAASPPAPTVEAAKTAKAAEAAPQPAADSGMLDFDMGDLSLDLDSSEGDTAGFDDIPEGDPLETKLSLAAEFLAIGDQEGARSLAEEVLEEATGALKAKATSFLSSLG